MTRRKFNKLKVGDMALSMDLSVHYIDHIMERAEIAWQDSKQKLCPPGKTS